MVRLNKSKLFEYCLICFTTFNIYCIAYYFSPFTPKSNENIGFLGWFDQGQYHLMYKSLLNLDFNPSNYFYGIGYPLIDLIFYPLNHFMFDKFFFLNSILLLISVISIYRMLENFGFKPMVSILFTTISLSPVIIYYVICFNNIVTISSFAYMLFFFFSPKKKPYGYLFLGVLVGLVFATRYSDVILFIPLICYMFWKEIMNKTFKFINLLLFSLPCVIWIVIVLLYHEIVFGSILRTPYDTHVRNINGIDISDKKGYFWNKILLSLYEIFINPYIMIPRNQIGEFYPLIKYIPVLPFAFIGLGYAVAKKIISATSMWVILLSVVISLAYYGSFWAVGGLELKYYNLRYFAFFYPYIYLVSIIGLYSLFNLWKEKLFNINIYMRGIYTTLVITIILLAFPFINKIVLDRDQVNAAKFTVTSSGRSIGTEYLFDENNTTRFTTNELRSKDQYIQINFNNIQSFSKMRVDSTYYADDRSKVLSFYISNDGSTYTQIEPIKVWFIGNNWYYEFKENKSKYLKIVNMDDSNQFYWSISDLYIKQ